MLSSRLEAYRKQISDIENWVKEQDARMGIGVHGDDGKESGDQSTEKEKEKQLTRPSNYEGYTPGAFEELKRRCLYLPDWSSDQLAEARLKLRSLESKDAEEVNIHFCYKRGIVYLFPYLYPTEMVPAKRCDAAYVAGSRITAGQSICAHPSRIGCHRKRC